VTGVKWAPTLGLCSKEPYRDLKTTKFQVPARRTNTERGIFVLVHYINTAEHTDFSKSWNGI